ncbi:class I SAM-dependent methyltransferase [Limibaculum sp. M0105]|uniref:Class I SAM-dependent methyltransferase n=1 Tax=Thermohalobaculum xanthum TaxID=2753746 RepID=A0A8J7SFU8_9RHOB|nr:class I SAM-dependent methyltransferase [Thermohalobaculum xanthum]MBK0400381.1 class I SAM-dependent methyltransferase [Thermohalobaculum xanthum]
MHEVAEYYDKFLATRMSRYRILGNLRLDLAKRRAKSLVANGDVVADFGCGIGIVSEAMASSRKGVTVIGVDASLANIEYAKRTVRNENVRFLHVDVSNGCQILANENPSGYNLITLIDVIEHIPESNRAQVLVSLFNITKDDGYLLLTYPSPEYQSYIISNDPEELQIIDEIIESNQLLSEAWAAGWKLKEFRYVDVWRRNQYVHAIFQKCDGLFNCDKIKRNWITVVAENSLIALLWPIRTWRYNWRLAGRKK